MKRSSWDRLMVSCNPEKKTKFINYKDHSMDLSSLGDNGLTSLTND